MNEVIEQLYRRKSIRVYTEREIGKAEKNAVLRAAAEAPTAGNQQLYTILDITVTEREIGGNLRPSAYDRPGENGADFLRRLQKVV